MSTIKILAVEDDPIYAESLEMIVAELGYDLVKITDNAVDTIAAVKTFRPDLILMDIEISDSVTGIELAARIRNMSAAPVIFVSSHKDRETLQRAKLTSPDAYIIKPYTKESLEVAIELALIRLDKFDSPEQEQEPSKDGFYIKDNGSLYKINPLDILYIEADEKYCTIHAKQKRHTINIRLKELFERLSATDFVQTHRSFIVRKDAIEKINITDQTLVIAGKEIPIGKTFKEVVLGKINYI